MVLSILTNLDRTIIYAHTKLSRIEKKGLHFLRLHSFGFPCVEYNRVEKYCKILTSLLSNVHFRNK